MILITFQTFSNPIDAHMLKNKLEANGVESFLFDEQTVSIVPIYDITIGGIKLKIRETDLELANKILLL